VPGFTTVVVPDEPARPAPPAKPAQVQVVQVTTSSSRTSRVRKVKPPPPPAQDPGRVVRTFEVKGEFQATADDAWASAWDEARCRVTHELNLSHAPTRDFLMNMKDQWEEEKGPTVEGVGETKRVLLRLNLTAAGEQELATLEREYRSQDRMETVARLLGVLTVLLGVVAGYVRLDEWTKGYYTGRLRLAAVVLVGLAGAAFLMA
jgi:hypothetical protein